MTDITYREMVDALAKPGVDIINDLTINSAHLLHMAVGVSGETGELLESYFLATNENKPLDIEHLIEECGDIEFYMEGIRSTCDLNFDPHLVLSRNPPEIFLVDFVKLSIAAANLLDQIKKYTIYAKVLDVESVDYYLRLIDDELSLIYGWMGVSRDVVRLKNMEKLSVRYKGLKYSNNAAQARADKQ